jgi:hypothetical protein
MPIVYLHVGPHKTGSTYLQNTFTQQASMLEKQGVLYPSIGREYSTGHHNIAWFFAQRPFINTNQERILAGLKQLSSSPQSNILLSSEEFSRVPKHRLLDLKYIFRDWHFHTIYFQRMGSGLIISLWQEAVKNGLATALDEITPQMIIENFNYNPMDHDGNLSAYKNTLDGSITVLDYNELMQSKVDLLVPVSKILGVEIGARKKMVNTSLSADVIELIRAANIFNAGLGHGKSWRPRLVCHRILKIPFFGGIFRKYIQSTFNGIRKSIKGETLGEFGFQQSFLSGCETDKTYAYTTHTTFFEKLNKDNLFPWRMIKMTIQKR